MNTDKFDFETVSKSDLPQWIESKKACYKDYVDQYYGGWIDAMQERLNTESFEKALQMSYFRKIVLCGETAGFCGYDEQADRIGGITIHMYEFARNRGIGSNFLLHLTDHSRNTGKPAYLKVFKTNPAKLLYEKFGFSVYDETSSHYLMVFRPSTDTKSEPIPIVLQ